VSFDIPSTILGGLVLNVMNLLLLDLYSREEVGFYSLAFRVAVLPLSLISASLSDVFFQKASASYRRTGGFWSELRFNITTAAFLSLLIFVPMALLARPVFTFVFGQRWLSAADMLVLLVPMLAVRFVSATIQTAPLVVGKANWLLAQNVALVTAMLIVYGTAKGLDLPIHPYLLLTSLLMALVYACNVLFIAALVNRSYRQPAVPVRSIGVAR
jgi:O-antigen/teichoic acid export membrane protein